MRLENVGSVDASWHIRFPQDMEVAVEQWANDSDPTREQIWQQAMVDRNIFLVEPRRGTLKRGESVRLQMVYYRKYPGRHDMPVILHVKKGKQLTINMIGESVASMPPLLTLTSLPLQLPSLPNTEPSRHHWYAIRHFIACVSEVMNMCLMDG
jgi:hypothetical protein